MFADRLAARREGTRRLILDAAWDIVRAQGLAGLSLRDLAKRVGMQAPSLYAYFDSKHAIYDAMFREGFEAFLDRIRDATELVPAAEAFADFCVEDPARYQLLFQRTIPGFEPSPEAYAPSLEALSLGRARLADAGFSSPEAVDIYTALVTGLVDQQISNDPGGDRWRRLIPEAMQMFTNHFGGTR